MAAFNQIHNSVMNQVDRTITPISSESKRPRKDLTGKRFGRLTVIGKGDRLRKSLRWNCFCDCGNSIMVPTEALNIGKSKSCGCLKVDVCKARMTTHGHAVNGKPDRVYRIWNAMIRRCYEPLFINFEDYGGRGITVCDTWRASLSQFITDMGQPPSETHSIDRIDVNGNYEPSNCRWATPKEQGRNKRNNVIITHDGVTQCASAWAEQIGVCHSTIQARYKSGWPIDKRCPRKGSLKITGNYCG